MNINTEKAAGNVIIFGMVIIMLTFSLLTAKDFYSDYSDGVSTRMLKRGGCRRCEYPTVAKLAKQAIENHGVIRQSDYDEAMEEAKRMEHRQTMEDLREKVGARALSTATLRARLRAGWQRVGIMRKINDFSATKIYTTMTAAALIIFGLICFFVVIPHDLKKRRLITPSWQTCSIGRASPRSSSIDSGATKDQWQNSCRDYRDAGQLSSELTHKNLVDSFRKRLTASASAGSWTN
jgi:hypothetical protein